MKRKLLFLILGISLLCNGCSPLKHQSFLLITSDSSAGLRALQDQPAAQGKIVLENVGHEKLSNLQLEIQNPVSGLSIINNNCSQPLTPNQSCSFTVQYRPDFKNTHTVNNVLINFLASATNQANIISQDGYTMVLQAVPHNTWVSVGEMNSISPQEDTSITKIERGNTSILYAYSKNNSIVNGYAIFRSTDAKHWSIVGSNWDKNLYPNDLVRDQDDNLYVAQSNVDYNKGAIVKFENNKWVAVGNWDNNWGVPIRLFNSNNILYAGCSSGIAKYDGHKWELVGANSWSKNESRAGIPWLQINNNLYASWHNSDNDHGGIVQYDGKSWTPVGDSSWDKANYGGPVSVSMSNGILYAGSNIGLMQFDGKNWSLVGKSSWNACTKYCAITSSDYGKIHSLLFGKDGKLYTGTSYGVVVYNPNLQQWTNLFAGWNLGWNTDSDVTADNGPLLTQGNLYGKASRLAENKGTLYSGSDRGVINYDGKRWRPADISWNYGAAKSIARDNGGNLYATLQNCSLLTQPIYCDMRIVKYDGKEWAYTENRPKFIANAQQLKINNILYAATDDGVLLYYP